MTNLKDMYQARGFKGFPDVSKWALTRFAASAEQPKEKAAKAAVASGSHLSTTLKRRLEQSDMAQKKK